MTHTSSSPSVCVLAGAAGAGAELLQRQLVMSGSSWSACLCCMQMGSSILYRSATCEAEAKTLPQVCVGGPAAAACHNMLQQPLPVAALQLAFPDTSFCC
jgi:hypothetical protein